MSRLKQLRKFLWIKKLCETTTCNSCLEIDANVMLNLSIMYSDVSGFIYSKQNNGN